MVVTGLVSLWIGWTIRGWYPEQTDPQPCNCSCNCYHQPPVDSSGSWSQSILLASAVIGVAGILANAALAFKVTVTSRSDSSSREVAFSVKGKSKGVYNPAAGLQITG